MEENIQNQPEEITADNYVSPDDVDVNLDEDYVIDWDNNTEEASDEASEVSLGEQVESQDEVDEVLESEDAGDQEEVESDLDGAVELGQIEEYEDDDEDPRYTQEEEDDDYEEDDSEEEEDELPEDWQKMIDFMEEFPGASPADYVKMTSGGDGMSDEQILKMHLASENGLDVSEDSEELDFLYEDKFGFDEELDSERDIKLKKIEAKKTLRNAKEQLSETQLKYGADLKFGDSSPELKELRAFQQEQTELQQQSQELAEGFHSATKDYFSSEFKGFEFKAGERNLRIKADPSKTADAQSDISNFISKYTGDDGNISDLGGYHKALWAANNADALFNHAYEQGKADAVRTAAKTAKNINMDPRSDRSAESEKPSHGFKIVDEGQNTEDFKFNF